MLNRQRLSLKKGRGKKKKGAKKKGKGKKKRSSPDVPKDPESVAVWQNFLETSRNALFALSWRCAPLGSTDRCAVIVETRQHPDLEYVLRNTSHFLGQEWSVLWFCGLDNIDWARGIQEKMPNLGVIQLAYHDLKKEYNAVLKSTAFWNSIPAENVLIFQTDALLRRTGIESFLEYDYVGACWHFGGFGNGGLSFRKKSKMIQMIQQDSEAKARRGNEDVFFIRTLQDDPTSHLPSVETAAEFSVESVYSPDSLGLHKTYHYLPCDQVRTLLSSIVYVA